MLKKMNVGRVAMCVKGAWNMEEGYQSLDLVTYDDALWISKGESVGQTPSEESEYWERIVDSAVEVSGGTDFEESQEEKEVLAFLPDMICVATDKTIEIYNKNVCPDADKYRLKWTCEVGKCYENKISIYGDYDKIGTYSLKLEIFDDNGICIKTLDSSVRISCVEFLNAQNMCSIGGKFVADAIWSREIYVGSSYMMAKYVGTCYNEIKDMYHEGRDGWTSETYLTKDKYFNSRTNEEEVNPFWDNGFSWKKYISTFSGHVDNVEIFFGGEELINSDEDSYVNNIMTIINTINSDVQLYDLEAVRILLVLPPLVANQNGFPNDSTGLLIGQNKYDLDRKYISAFKKLYERVKAANYDNIYIIPVTSCFDTDYNFGSMEIQAIPRHSRMITVPERAVYPTDEGYNQLSDIVFCAYMPICLL